MNAKTLFLFAAAVSSALSADTYDERLAFVETDGSQWIDTGIHPNPKRTRIAAAFRVMEYPAGITNGTYLALYGSLNEKNNRTGWEYFSATDRKSCYRSFGCFIGRTEDCHRLFPAWTGSTASGYYQPTTGNYTTMTAFEVVGYQAAASVNGRKTAGYYDASRFDETLTNTLYIGNVNNAGCGLYTPPEECPRIQWYRFRVWLDDVPVGDFIPVKKNGVAGFFDQVGGTFYPSAGTAPFIAPVLKTWTGEGTADFTDDGNWTGGLVPETERDVAYFPSGVTSSVPLSAIATLNGLGGIRVDAGALVSFTNAVGKGDFLPPFLGNGTIRFADSPPANALKCHSDSQGFAGRVEVTNSYLHVLSPNCLGGESAEVHVWLDDTGYRFYCTSRDAGSARYFFHRTGQFVFTPESTELRGPVVVDTPNNISFHANGSQTFRFSGGFVVGGSTPTNQATTLGAGFYYMENPDALYDIGPAKLIVQAHLKIGAPLACEKVSSDTVWKNANIVVNSNAKNGLRFGAANVLPDHTYVTLNYADGLTNVKPSTIGLDGFDQRLGTLAYYSNAGTGDNDPGSVWNTNMVIESSSPATLTLCHGMGDGYEINYHYRGIFAGRVNGAASIVLDSASETPGKIRFNCPGSTTSGSLTARRGTVEIMPTATFTNLTGLVASGDGKLIVNTSAVGQADRETAPYLVLTNVTAGSLPLTIGAGCSLTVETAVVGGGRWLKEGVYTAARLPRYLDGAGELVVKAFGGKPGLLLIVR